MGVGEAGPGSWKRVCAAAVWYPWSGPAPLARTAPWLGNGWGQTSKALLLWILRTAFLSLPPSPAAAPSPQEAPWPALAPQGLMSEPQPDLEPPQHGLYMLFLLVLVFFLMGLVGFMICHVLKKKGYRCRTSRGSEPDDTQLQLRE